MLSCCQEREQNTFSCIRLRVNDFIEEALFVVFFANIVCFTHYNTHMHTNIVLHRSASALKPLTDAVIGIDHGNHTKL